MSGRVNTNNFLNIVYESACKKKNDMKNEMKRYRWNV